MKKISLIVILGFVLLTFLIPILNKPYKDSITDNLYKPDLQSMASDLDIKNSVVVKSNSNNSPIFVTIGNNTSVDNIFEAGSNGKVVTAYIIIKLVERGQLSLDKSIAPYLSENLFSENSLLNQITIRDLLSHKGGFSPSFEFGIDKKIYFTPGEKFMYSGVGYIYLQDIIENVTNEKFEVVAQKMVFQPLGMHNSTFSDAKIITPYISLSDLTIYIVIIFSVLFILILGLVSIVNILFKKIFPLKNIFFTTIILALLVQSTLILIIISKLFIYLVIFGFISLIMLFIIKKKDLNLYIYFPFYLLIIVILGLNLSISVPLTRDIFSRQPNAAYSLKTTGKDFSLFVEELIFQYNNGSNVFKEMFVSQINITDRDDWGLGIGIKKIDDKIYYWHSGINIGFQSLFIIDPTNSKYVIVLTNSYNGITFAREVVDKYKSINVDWDIKK